ncbi:opioid growth factor receptor-like isoform X2 [Notolabrus celidotus]|uniref:opioid growth factor receptor-like isoform X2 n=1 Tax=Notolabrus celidotus TaxID=1203425 RepID=UPI0014908657|nr:opioid growth factor receptor-like isoform X2 [Notolabrus celidotus]
MAWFGRLSSAIHWISKMLCRFWRWTTLKFYPALGGETPGRRIESGSIRVETEISEKLPESCLTVSPPAVFAVKSEYNIDLQEETTGEDEAAGLVGVSKVKRKSCGEEDEDDFDSHEYRVKTTDEFYCGYDSTWETEDVEKDPRECISPPMASDSYKFRRFESAARDMQNYRHDYPNQQRSRGSNYPDTQPNLNFYLGNTPSVPDDMYITSFHSEWLGSYEELEYVHTYIQWLFPLPEPGMNYQATPLTRKEVEDFCQSSDAKENLLKSYKLMLDFYGIELCDEATGKVKRASNWEARYNNLNSHTHNNLRITRILKCLGILGFPHYQAPLVRFFLKETLVEKELPNVRDSVLNYFLFAVRDRKQRRGLIKFAYEQYKHEEFVWCPRRIQELWSCPIKAIKRGRLSLQV